MIQWLLLVSLFCKSTQDGNGQENGVSSCGPKDPTLTDSNQKILVTWKDEPSCSAVHDMLIYELVVLIADEQDEVAVMHDQIGSTHFWNWTPHLALEYFSHTIRLSSRCKNCTSPPKLKTLLRNKSPSRPQVYPRDKAFKVGSNVTFFCVLPEGEIFDEMFLSGYSSTNMDPRKISNQTYALTVNLNQPSNGSCTNVICKGRTQHSEVTDNGACAYIGYPPGDKDLQCETRDLKYVECHWTPGGNTYLRKKTNYTLQGSPCEAQSQGTCKKEVQVVDGEGNWTLTAENKLGKLELSERADLTKRVHMFAPENVRASTVHARNVSLQWDFTEQPYTRLNLTCQVNCSHGGTNIMIQNTGVGLSFAVLTDLIPNWRYNVRVRCGTTQHFWKWSDWSERFNFHTKGDVFPSQMITEAFHSCGLAKVPDALDVWMHMKDNQTIIIWKMLLANQSHGHIENYTVTWVKTTTTEQKNRAEVAHNKYHLALSLDITEEYIVTVTATNEYGSSSPSTITTPSFNPNTIGVNTPQIIGNNGSFSLSWSSSPSASCGYIVDWFPTTGHCSVEWLKVPPHVTNTRIFSKNFTDGLRYSLSIYACTQGAPVLLERREGYVNEERIQDNLFKKLKWKQQDSNVEVSWDPISLSGQTAFIQGYILYWSNDNNNNMVFNVSTVIPEATSLTARNLKISSYTFTVKAQTAVGECGTTSFTATLNSLTDNLIKAVIISLVTIFSFLSLITVICYRHWACIKQRVYPPIPKPMLTDKWLTSVAEHSCHPLRVDQCHYSEIDIMDIPELFKSGAPVNGYVCPENMPFVFAQTPKGYYNQPLKKLTPQPLILPTPANASQSGLPSSPFRGVFTNLSYNLIKTEDQQSDPGPELQEGKSLEENSSGYKPQSSTETYTLNQKKEDSECSISYVSTYILLPQ